MQQKYEGPITRNRTKRKIECEDKTKSVFIGGPIKDISFINYAGYTEVSNTEEKQNKEIELRHCLLASLNRDPVSYQKALMTKEKECWKKAIKDELDSMQANKVWKLVGNVE